MLNLIVAPKVHNDNAETIAKSVVKYLKQEKVEYSVYFSESFASITENVENLISFGENEFVIIGDDAVISSVLNSVKDISKLKIGIIPTGKKDDFASYLGLETKPIEATKKILEKSIETVDFLLANNMKVINNIVIGASAEIFEAYDQFKLKNPISQIYAESKYGKTFAGIELTLDVKGSKNKTEKVFELVVANGGNCKGKHISPLSNVEDGLFNLIYTTTEQTEDKKKTLKLFNTGNHIYEENTKQQWINNLKITNPDKKIKALIDGAVYTFESLDISVIEKGLKIYNTKK